jgi:uncharacterized membrane protein YoaK (UPF0700 family)
MSDSLLITSLIVAIFSISVLVGYVVARKSRRAGLAVASTGSLSALVLVVDYFVEVPVEIVAATLAAVAASLVFALFEVIRKDAIPKPS